MHSVVGIGIACTAKWDCMYRNPIFIILFLLRNYAAQIVSSKFSLSCQCSFCHSPCMELHTQCLSFLDVLAPVKVCHMTWRQPWLQTFCIPTQSLQTCSCEWSQPHTCVHVNDHNHIHVYMQMITTTGGDELWRQYTKAEGSKQVTWTMV